MEIGREKSFWIAVSKAWPLWWRLSVGWIAVVFTLWLVPGDLLQIAEPKYGLTIELISWLLFPLLTALVLMMLFLPVLGGPPQGHESGTALSSNSIRRTQKLIVVGLLLSSFVAIFLVLGIKPGPKLENFVQNLVSGHRFDVASEKLSVQKPAGEIGAVKPATKFDAFFDEISKEEQEAEKVRLENELRELQSGQSLKNEITRLKRAVEFEKARLECEKHPETCDIEAPDEQN